MKKFALIGAGGFIAPRHMKAIKETGNDLIAAIDPSDSVGIIDSYFPDAHFFTEFERFDRHIEKLRQKGEKIDYVSICSPNYLHDAHIRFALRSQANAICEKPIVLNPWNVDALCEIEKESHNNIYTILQLRHHPSIIEIKNQVDKEKGQEKKYDVELSYITSRGKWYDISWKGNIEKSGGVATNIGVHFFDMLSWIFGPVKENLVHLYEPRKVAGVLYLQNATVRWYLSLDELDLPKEIQTKGQKTFRSIKINDKEIEFSGGFTDLHTVSYQNILNKTGYGIAEAKNAVEIVYQIRKGTVSPLNEDHHPFIKQAKSILV